MNLLKTVERPMDDSSIRKYLPSARIVTSKELNNYKSIDELLPNKDKTDYVIILFLDSPSSGHWCSLSRYGAGKTKMIEYFNSYGGSPSETYDYVPLAIRNNLGCGPKHLCKLLNECNEYVLYNPIKYQSEGGEDFDVNTCGRHTCFRLIELLGKGTILPAYYDLMKEQKKKTGLSYDAIVAKLIEK